MAKATANVAALRTLRQLQDEQRAATAEEQQTLARWAGWGAVPRVFDDQDTRFEQIRAQLRDLLGEQEWNAARRNTLNAHYTDADVVAAIWDGAKALGFDGGRVLEPGAGAGTFIGSAPSGCDVVGVELEPVSAGVAQALYPDATILHESFADTRLPEGSFDVAIGNVPFGAYALHDPRHNRRRHTIHNHFLIKSLHLTRPGGLVVALTSRYTMDATNPAARREMAELADLVGAIRLPAGTHRRAAGTDVVTDLLILRRREPGQEPRGAAWERALPLPEGPAAGATVNEFFHSHPEAVQGRFDVQRGAYREDELTVVADGDLVDVATRLRATLNGVAEHARAAGLAYTPADRVPSVASDQAQPAALVPRVTRDPEGFIRAHDDATFTQVVAGVEQPLTPPATQHGELRQLLGLRDTTVALLTAEAAALDDTDELTALRAQLNRRYDTYVRTHGPLGRFSWRRTGRVDQVTGEDKLARIRPPMGGFRSDTFAATVFALESFDATTQTATKADIFTSRVVAPRTAPLGADSAEDALAISLDLHGRADVDQIARLLGVDVEQAREQLGTLVFDDPAQDGALVPAAEYLSGNVRNKLTQAQEAAEADPRYQPNVGALTAVIPTDLGPGEIEARLGSAWISPEDVQAFLREILEDPRVRVERAAGTAWRVEGTRFSVLAREVWGTDHAWAGELAADLLEQRPITVYDVEPGGSRSLNLTATVAAQEKAKELNDRFGEWVWEDPARAERLTRIYNDTFNSTVLRSYDDVRLTLPGLARSFTPRPHQHAAVARILHEPAVLLAHEVGAGKTAEMVMGAMELRRLGVVNKPAIVIPNHMLEQFSRETLALYPQAKVLMASTEDLAGDRRRAFVARVATGDWDVVVMTRSAFERVPMSAANQKAYLEREVAGMRAWLASSDGASRQLVKRIEKKVAAHEERLKAKLDSDKDAGISFELTGIDYLLVDEAHGYKNLRTISNRPSAAVDGSQRASDLDMKLSWLREQAGPNGRYATLATATPISNSVTEAHVMQRYLRPDLLERAGVLEFDAWAGTFGQDVTEIELSPDGAGFRINTRFAKFQNVPELLTMFHVPADVKTAEDLKLPTPALRHGKAETVVVDRSPELEDFISHLGRRAEQVRARAVDPSEDNMLAIATDGRKAALDMRLVGGATDSATKVAVAAEHIAAIWDQHKDDVYPGAEGADHPVKGALQLVFCDLGTPNPERWNAYDELREQLVSRGVPADGVRFIHEARTDREKADLFAAARSGRVAVLVGSTEKMGVGTNVQARAIALHHLDCPWRPADIQQREGRILRQGNLNPEVRVIRYVTEGSFDAYMWQGVERKQRFITQLMRGKLDTREIEDIGDAALSFNEVKALAAGNPHLLDKARADADLTRLDRLERSWRESQQSMRHTITRNGVEVAAVQGDLQRLKAAQSRLVETTGERFAMTVAGTRFAKRVEAAGALQATVADLLTAVERDRQHRAAAPIGELGGMTVMAEAGRTLGGVAVVELGFRELPDSVARRAVVRADLAGDGVGLVRTLENQLELPKVITRLEARLAAAQAEIQRATERLGGEFPHREALDDARARSLALAQLIEQQAAPPQPGPEADQAGSEAAPETSEAAPAQRDLPGDVREALAASESSFPGAPSYSPSSRIAIPARGTQLDAGDRGSDHGR